MITPFGEPQADHIRTKPNGDKKETSPTISTYCRTFFIVSVLLKRQKGARKETVESPNRTPFPKKRLGGGNEVYLIAAEADIYLNGGANAAGCINKVRERAGANPLTGSITVRDILDERDRELCGEYCRFYDLKRTGMFKESGYLENTHPDLARFFHPNYALRPISTTFTATITNGSEYQNPGY